MQSDLALGSHSERRCTKLQSIVSIAFACCTFSISSAYGCSLNPFVTPKETAFKLAKTVVLAKINSTRIQSVVMNNSVLDQEILTMQVLETWKGPLHRGQIFAIFSSVMYSNCFDMVLDYPHRPKEVPNRSGIWLIYTGDQPPLQYTTFSHRTVLFDASRDDLTYLYRHH